MAVVVAFDVFVVAAAVVVDIEFACDVVAATFVVPADSDVVVVADSDVVVAAVAVVVVVVAAADVAATAGVA